MTDTAKPGDIHGHPIMECSDVRHAASRVHNHDSPGSSHCSFEQGREYVGDRPHFCTFAAWQPWVDLLAERDEARKELAALRVLDGASAGRAETERDEAREEQR